MYSKKLQRKFCNIGVIIFQKNGAKPMEIIFICKNIFFISFKMG